MTKKTISTIGFFAGAIIGGAVTILEIAPAPVAILMKPLEWLTENLHPFPSESLANLIIAFPVIFIYWGCLGALAGLLLRAAALTFLKREVNGISLSFNINDEQDGLMSITFRGIANTNSSRNWEGDPNMMKNAGQ